MAMAMLIVKIAKYIFCWSFQLLDLSWFNPMNLLNVFKHSIFFFLIFSPQNNIDDLTFNIYDRTWYEFIRCKEKNGILRVSVKHNSLLFQKVTTSDKVRACMMSYWIKVR